MQAYPEQDELVLATVKKLLPYGAFLALEEYPGRDGFLHVSQVSSGWVRNIREHLKEGQRLVVKVTTIDLQKQQIDLSLKQVSEADKKRKLAAHQAEKKSIKFLEIAAVKLKKDPKKAYAEAGEVFVKEFGSVSAAIDAIRDGPIKTALPAEWITALKEIAEKEFKPKLLEVRTNLLLKCFDGDGVEKIKQVLAMIGQASNAKATITVHYVGAPNYYVDVSGYDYKTIEKAISGIELLLDDYTKKGVFEFEMQPNKK